MLVISTNARSLRMLLSWKYHVLTVKTAEVLPALLRTKRERSSAPGSCLSKVLIPFVEFVGS